MEIQKKLLKFKFHILFTLSFSWTSLPAADSHIEHHKAAAEDILGYVAGQDHAVQHPPPQTEAEDEGEPVPQSFHHTQSGSSS
ncbi:hypothetical protein Patl1_03958 [Pistacia atlantica]|uniref:Uncharacterized protein n=1 Tax=Pistacia atlantica TaxID=434234 RepID=A0ACC1BSW6_9ROSI|nr:hypothetical protein Patl1_03958 [Pistacia atlantica]